MLVLSCQIALGNYSLDFTHNISVATSYETLTDLATIELPRNVVFEGEKVALGEGRILKRGTQVQIRTGYDGSLETLFTGYITEITPGVPVQIGLEDEMWQLKQNRNTFSEKQTTLKKLLSAVCPIPFQSVDADLGAFRVEDASTARILRTLYDDYNLRSFIRDGKLYVGLSYWPELQQTHRFGFEHNIISHDLSYQQEEDVRARVKAISNLDNGQKLEVVVGDEEGVERTLNYYNVTSSAELKARAEAELKKIKFTGLRGSFLTFGEPLVRHGDIIELIDPREQYAGKYIAEKNEISFGLDGYRQRITLSEKIG